MEKKRGGGRLKEKLGNWRNRVTEFLTVGWK